MAGSAGIHDSLIIDFDVFRKCWNLFVVMTGFWLGRCGQGHGMVCCVPLSIAVNFPVDLRHTSYRRELRVYNVPYTHGLP